MFEQRDGDQQFSDAATLCAAIIDWADPDENLATCDLTKLAAATPASGAEDSIYQVLGLDYRRKNAAFDSLQELRLIRGMDDDRWTTFFEPDGNDPRKRLVTVWGQDVSANSININTANAQTLWAIICSVSTEQTAICQDPIQAAAFLQVITLVRTFARGVPLFASWGDLKAAVEGKGMVGQFLAGIGVPPVTFDPAKASNKELKKIFKTESKVFSIYTEGVVPGTQREARVRIHAVVDMRESVDWTTLAANAAATAQGQAPPADKTSVPGVGSAQPDAPVDDDFIKELKTNPFGSVIYYRVD